MIASGCSGGHKSESDDQPYVGGVAASVWGEWAPPPSVGGLSSIRRAVLSPEEHREEDCHVKGEMFREDRVSVRRRRRVR